MTCARISMAALIGLSALSAGCQGPDIGALQGKIIALQQENEKLKEDKQNQREVIQEQQKKIETLRSLGGQKRLEKLYQVRSISLGWLTSGVGGEGDKADEGIKVFLEPVDQTGSIIKAAGDVKIQLYDLAAPPKENLIKEFLFNVDEVAKHWYGGFGAYHYSFECLWKDNPPRHNELTVRVEFIDYLTGKTFSAQTVCKVRLPPSATQPATEPAQPTTGEATQPATRPTTQR
jgi:hypothetical protein